MSVFAPEEQYVYSRYSNRRFRSSGAVCGIAAHSTLFGLCFIALVDVVRTDIAIPKKRNAYGQKYIIDFEMSHLGQTAEIRTVWIVRDNDNFPRFLTCYISTKRGPDETT